MKRPITQKGARLGIWYLLLESARGVRLRQEAIDEMRASGASDADVEKARANFEAARAEVERVIKSTHFRGRR